MNYIIAQEYKSRLASLPFIDVLAGLTKIHTEEIPNSEGNLLIQRFPVECTVTAEQCRGGDYIDLSPDGRKKSIIYFEDLGSQFIDKDVREMTFLSRLRLIGWINLNRFVDGGCSMSAQVVSNIINELIGNAPFNLAGPPSLTKARVTQITQLPKNTDIFLRYSYDESITQYLMYPFDFFALEIGTTFHLPMACIPTIEMQDPAC